MDHPSADHASAAADTLERVRRGSPLVHNIINYVAMDVAANALLAVGASPVMAHALDEMRDFVAIAGALTVNIGTLSPPWVEAMLAATAAAAELGKPWVLDPVGVGATPYRTGVARELAGRRPTVIRGNASEILVLAGDRATRTKGVDSTRAADEARDAARALARSARCAVAVTGAVDYVTDGASALAVANGHVMMTRITALGCTATALVGACLAVGVAPVAAAAHALAILGACGEIAARDAAGPGSLRWRLIDALYQIDADTLRRTARVEPAEA
jgi:hydroxyethylthiazole kinase